IYHTNLILLHHFGSLSKYPVGSFPESFQEEVVNVDLLTSHEIAQTGINTSKLVPEYLLLNTQALRKRCFLFCIICKIRFLIDNKSGLIDRLIKYNK
ncbi:MAG: hypothetical protein KAI99_20550, partial [Cyclobacteriaceae bacterium]|nr:hypothetical protein [Cyclobacteriaceae bacterium]